MRYDFREWGKAAGVRAVIGTEMVGFTDLDWLHIISVAGVAAVLSLLTSVAGLPELEGGGHE